MGLEIEEIAPQRTQRAQRCLWTVKDWDGLKIHEIEWDIKWIGQLDSASNHFKKSSVPIPVPIPAAMTVHKHLRALCDLCGAISRIIPNVITPVL